MNIKFFVVLIFVGWLIAPLAANAQAFGRVFSTPQERQYLDRLRKEMFAELTEAERIEALQKPTVPVLPEEAPPTIIHMGGTVKRADGSHTIWVNGVPVDEKSLPSNARLDFQGGMGVLVVTTIDGVVTLRPGQTYNESLGAVREDYELTPVQLQALQNELARREALNRPAPSERNRTQAPTNSDVAEESSASSEEEQTQIQEVLDAVRSLQEARDSQELLP